MENIEDVKQAAVEHFASGFNCAEAVLLAIAQALNLDTKQIPAIATGFGAGIGRCGEVCGALSGAVMALGLRHGRSTPDDARAKDALYAKTDELLQAFQEEFGDIRCLSLTGCNFRTPEGTARFRELGLHKTLCPQFVAFAAEYACRMIEED